MPPMSNRVKGARSDSHNYGRKEVKIYREALTLQALGFFISL